MTQAKHSMRSCLSAFGSSGLILTLAASIVEDSFLLAGSDMMRQLRQGICTVHDSRAS